GVLCARTRTEDPWRRARDPDPLRVGLRPHGHRRRDPGRGALRAPVARVGWRLAWSSRKMVSREGAVLLFLVLAGCWVGEGAVQDKIDALPDGDVIDDEPGPVVIERIE